MNDPFSYCAQKLSIFFLFLVTQKYVKEKTMNVQTHVNSRTNSAVFFKKWEYVSLNRNIIIVFSKNVVCYHKIFLFKTSFLKWIQMFWSILFPFLAIRLGRFIVITFSVWNNHSSITAKKMKDKVGKDILQGSISSTFFVRLLCTKVLCAAFLCYILAS